MNPDIKARVAAWLDQHLPEALEILRQMVAINSFTGNAAGVNRLGELTAEVFAPLGFQAERRPSDTPGHGDHLILRRGSGNGRKIGLVTHLDTVFPPEEEQRQAFHWSIEGDRIYGPGTNDIKGGTVMIYLLLRALQAVAPEAFERVNWVILADAHEEQQAEDFGRLCLQELGPEPLACLIFESGARQQERYSIVVARKGRLEFKVEAEGRAAHAGGAHAWGVNAIVQLARLLPEIAAMTREAQDLTVNLGTVTGGTVINRVPHHAEAVGELRAFCPELIDQARTELLALNQFERQGIPRERSLVDGFAAQIRVSVLHQSTPWPRNPATDRLYELWSRTAASLGWKTLAEHRGGLSDGNYLATRIPTLDGLGPSGGNDHCSERSADGAKLPEYVEISSFVPKALLNVLAVHALILEGISEG